MCFHSLVSTHPFSPEVGALRHLLDFTAGLLAGGDPDGAVMLDGASAWLRDRQLTGPVTS